MNLPKTFCPLPWTHQATYTDGSLLLCCVANNDSQLNLNRTGLREAFNGTYWKNVRRQMLNGESPKSCRRCWVEEKNGYKSHRLTEVEVWTRRLGHKGLKALIEKTSPDGGVDFFASSVDLRIGNTCNLQCVMCRPHESAKWFGLSKVLADQAIHFTLKRDMIHKKSIRLSDYDWQDRDTIWEELRGMAPELKELIIGGGEPMLLKGHIEFIKFCVDHNYAKDIHLRYHTNLTVLNKNHFELWKHFKIVEFFASIDGLGEKNHYVRYPAKWEDIEKNLDYLESLPYPNVKTMILFSSHFLSLYDLDELAQWIEEKNFKKVTHGFNGYFHPGIVMEPAYLSPQVYPPAIKDEITKKLLDFEKRSKKPSYKIAGVLSYMNAKDRSTLLPSALEYIQLLDKNRSTKFSETFPRLSQRLKEHCPDQ